MSTLVMVLRSVSLLAFAGPMTLRVSKRRRETEPPARQSGTARVRVVANLAAVGVFFPSLLIFSGSSEASLACLWQCQVASSRSQEPPSFSDPGPSWARRGASCLRPIKAEGSSQPVRISAAPFGERYVLYRRPTTMIIPHLF
jgi:hypothetical protein